MQNCSNCESMVTPAFTRVFGDNDGTVDGCVHCRGTMTESDDEDDEDDETEPQLVTL